MLFIQRGDAVLLSEPWPAEADFAAEFLEAAVYPWVQVGDGIVSLRVTNGSASYGLVGYELMRHAYRGRLGPGSTWTPA